MPRKIKSKIAAGIGVLFALLITISVVSFVFINLLSHRTENLLTANYKTIQYCNQMMHTINSAHLGVATLKEFEDNLNLQENNITEKGEGRATEKLRFYFEQIKRDTSGKAMVDSINKQLFDIALLNQHALERKNAKALATANTARLWISLIATIILLTGFVMLLNFPGYIAGPVSILTQGIREIAQKKYDKRIYIDNKDEFGEMAASFNQMAEKLYEYEHSSVHKIMSEKQRLDTIINQMQDGVIGLNASNKILFINHTAEQLLNLDADDVKGKYAPDVALHNDLFRYIVQQNEQTQPLKIVVDGKEEYFSVNCKSIYSEGETIGMLFMLSNITNLKELDISKTNLLATISHELKTPVSSIKMSLKLLTGDKQHELTTDQKQLVKGINDDTDRILRITTELLNMTQIEKGHIKFNKQSVQPDSIIAAAMQAITNVAAEKDITVKTMIPPALPAINCDPEKTSWVLINFLTNGIRYSGSGSEITLRVEQKEDTLQFSVRDLGKGIEAQYHDAIFKAYFQMPGNADKLSTGLGLSICKEFIEAQGGKIWFESELGKGSEFFFSIPLAA